MIRKRRKRSKKLERQLALSLLADAMSKAEKGRSYPEAGYSEGTPVGKSLRSGWRLNGPEIAE
jgi:hypothetical protein